VWKFIVEREIEAPDRFQSIQTYRCSTTFLTTCLIGPVVSDANVQYAAAVKPAPPVCSAHGSCRT